MNDGLFGLPGYSPRVVAGPWGNSNIGLSAVNNGTQLIITATARNRLPLGVGGPAVVAFPNADVSIGDYKLTTISQPVQPLVIASGSTMAFSANVPGKLWVVLFDDISGPALGVINCVGTNSIYPLGQNQLASTSATSGGASTAQVIYSNRAIVGRPFIILGYMTFEAGLATPGTWNSNPTRVRLYGPGVKLPGDTVQIISVQSGAGVTVISAIITPTSAANAVLVGSVTQFSGSASVNAINTVKRGATTIAVGTAFVDTAGAITPVTAPTIMDFPGVTTATTYTANIAGHSVAMIVGYLLLRELSA